MALRASEAIYNSGNAIYSVGVSIKMMVEKLHSPMFVEHITTPGDAEPVRVRDQLLAELESQQQRTVHVREVVDVRQSVTAGTGGDQSVSYQTVVR